MAVPIQDLLKRNVHSVNNLAQTNRDLQDLIKRKRNVDLTNELEENSHLTNTTEGSIQDELKRNAYLINDLEKTNRDLQNLIKRNGDLISELKETRVKLQGVLRRRGSQKRKIPNFGPENKKTKSENDEHY